MLNQFPIDSLDLTSVNLVSACHHLLICQSTRCSRPECEKLQNAGMIRSKSCPGKGPEEREVMVPILPAQTSSCREGGGGHWHPAPSMLCSPRNPAAPQEGGEGGRNLQIVGDHASSDTRHGAIPCRDLIFLFLLVLNRIPLVNL